MDLRYTLLTDGSSDDALIPCLTWVLRTQGVRRAIQPQWAELRNLPEPPKTLTNRVKVALDLYPCDLLFVHRDAEAEEREVRETEIYKAVAEAANHLKIPPVVCVVPVRMMEAWLLFSESAVRRAAGNPNGRMVLDLPRPSIIERMPDPKAKMFEVLREASGLHGRRRKSFVTAGSSRRIADFLDDFYPLRGVPAFDALEAEVAKMVELQGWNVPQEDKNEE